MNEPERIGADQIFERDLYVWLIPALDAWPADRPWEARHFGCLLALDAAGVTDEAILAAAGRMLDQGLVYLCAWGPDCKRVRDVFERAIAERGMARGLQMVLTSWHDELLDEAAGFFCDTQPAMVYEDTATVWIAVAIGNDGWAEVLRRRLAGRATS